MFGFTAITLVNNIMIRGSHRSQYRAGFSQSVIQSKHICMAPYVANESHIKTTLVEYTKPWS